MLYYLSLGSNMGDRERALREAVALVVDRCGRVVKKSAVYETASWGFQGEDFLNMALIVDSKLEPKVFLDTCLQIEVEQGRQRMENREKKRKGKEYHSRTLDIDIIFIDDMVIDCPELSVPHPLMQNRPFVLYPLIEIAPDFTHPVLKLKLSELANLLKQ